MPLRAKGLPEAPAPLRVAVLPEELLPDELLPAELLVEGLFHAFPVLVGVPAAGPP